MGYFKQKDCVIFYGTVSGNVRHRVFESGKMVTNFGVAYEKTLDENGEKKKSVIYVDAWGKNLASYAACLERGDIVLVAGRLKRDDYMSQKNGTDSYKLNADLVICQPTADYEDGEYNEEAADALEREERPRRGGKTDYEKNYREAYEDPGLVELPGDDGGELPF